MASTLQVEFQFEINEIVYSKTALADMQCEIAGIRSLMIQTRNVEECCGGVQKFYAVCSDGKVFKIPEAALVGSVVAAEMIAAQWDKMERRKTR